MVDRIRLTTPSENGPLSVTLKNGKIIIMPAYPSEGEYDEKIKAYLDAGGAISPYDPDYGKTPEDFAEEQRQVDIDVEKDKLKQVYLALKNGTGTSAVRLARVEKVLAFLIRDKYRADS